MIPWLLEALSPAFVGLAIAAVLLAGASGVAALRGWRAHRRTWALDRELARVAPAGRCPACGSPSTWEAARRCGCWSGR